MWDGGLHEIERRAQVHLAACDVLPTITGRRGMMLLLGV
jgi:hypothetical protein